MKTLKKNVPQNRKPPVKDLEPSKVQVVKGGDDMSLSLNFEKYKTTFTEYDR